MQTFKQHVVCGNKPMFEKHHLSLSPFQNKIYFLHVCMHDLCMFVHISFVLHCAARLNKSPLIYDTHQAAKARRSRFTKATHTITKNLKGLVVVKYLGTCHTTRPNRAGGLGLHVNIFHINSTLRYGKKTFI